MEFSGQCIQVKSLDSGIFELHFNAEGEPVNKFDAKTLTELKSAVEALEKKKPSGLLITSGKDAFIVGADITEFVSHFKRSESELSSWIGEVQTLFSRIEDLPCPSVVAINGFALGGGFELCLTADYRAVSATAKVGLPETKLGIYPGWGGTVRLSRLCGVDTAIEWVAMAKNYGGEEAQKHGAIDAVLAPEKLRDGALSMLKQAMDGKLNWRERRAQKVAPVMLTKVDQMMAFETSKGFILGQTGGNYPAPLNALEAIQNGCNLPRDEAMKVEAAGFAKTAKTPQALALVRTFLGDQFVKKQAKKFSKGSAKIEKAAVLGAGIMGGGIAYQSASSDIPIVMKDIRDEALELGMNEAAKIIEKRVEKGQAKVGAVAKVLSKIRPTLNYAEVAGSQIVVEAVVENEKIKASVIADLENTLDAKAIIASNTSTISISRLAKGMKHPERFCGMHFFNPVPRMPLVEVIRGEKSSAEAIATTVAYAQSMGKTPIVVGDCPGFLVNRVLFPYFNAFQLLIRDGVAFERIDKVMEKYGWPMGPAYLLDVVGIDTGYHAESVMSEGFPDRMKPAFKSMLAYFYEAKRFGQKNGKGFSSYAPDAKGRPQKSADPEVQNVLKPFITGTKEAGEKITDQEIIERMMLSMIFECARCLEDKIVETPIEVDISLMYGLGFPPFRGGAMQVADSMGAKAMVELGKKYSAISPLYKVPASIEAMANNGSTYY